MNIAEILRKLADVVDGKEQAGGTEIVNRPDNAPAVEPETGEDTAVINVEPMVPPLQQKLELLKKIAGEEGGNEVCPACGHEPCECGHEDELTIMKRNAGMPMMTAMPTLLAHIADEDEPWEG